MHPSNSVQQIGISLNLSETLTLQTQRMLHSIYYSVRDHIMTRRNRHMCRCSIYDYCELGKHTIEPVTLVLYDGGFVIAMSLARRTV